MSIQPAAPLPATARTVVNAATAQAEFEREMRAAVGALVAAIAKQHGPAVAARVVAGLYEKYKTAAEGV